MNKLIFTLSILISTVSYGQSFDVLASSFPHLSNSRAAFGDADGDGDLDLYLSGINISDELEGGLYLYDSGAYTLSTTANLPLQSYGSIAWGDIDHDGDQDILIQGNDNDGTSFADVHLNNNDGTFTALNVALPPSYLGEVAFVDINNDDNLDIAITGFESGTSSFITKIYKNNGDTTFSEITGLDLPGMNFGRIKFADYNNDGYSDFALSGFNQVDYTFYIAVYTNNQDETFTKLTGTDFFQCWLGDTEWGDYNGDGFVDLVVSGTGGSSGVDRQTNLYKNNGDSTFTNINAGFAGVSHSSLEWADFDADGDIDLFVTGVTSTPGEGNDIATIYINEGSDTFTDSEISIFNISYYGDADSGDIDGDGKPELVVTGFDHSHTKKSEVYKNTTGLSLTEFNREMFNIYPNPSVNKTIRIDYNSSNTNISDLRIYNLSGQKVYQKSLQSTSGFNSSIINLTDLKSAIYILEINLGDKLLSKKLLVQ